MSTESFEELLKILKTRFQNNLHRHPDIQWDTVQAKLEQHPEKLRSLVEMEATGGEPDVVAYNADRDQITFYDCSAESPNGRRSLCYDREALESRKEHKPKNTVIDMAKAMGIELMTEAQYRHLQELGEFDRKTSSWIRTPEAIRKLGGAVFCDRRYNTVFMYHNGVESYYAARGFRGVLNI
ncbi:MAG: DUF4256 domain-containing protein [Flavobacteriaceae bacterium]|nr:DUF4256 domain-containing protein [Flavobacteriaceae bacterium]